MRNILFVCTGNTCRSIMAEGILKDLLEKRGIADNIYVKSAGIAAFPGQPATEQAIYVMHKRGIDISKHRARQLNKDIINDFNLVLTMTKRHKDIILQTYPESANKVFVLKEYAYNDKIDFLDITDPYGQSIEVYEKTAEEISKALKEIIDNKLKNSSN